MASPTQPTGTSGTASPPTATVRPKAGRRVVLLLSIAVFAQESVWNFYDAQVPASLRVYIASAGVIGLLMGVDNVFGVVLQPLMGHFSDRLRRRKGSRVPIILVGAPVAAVFFVLIPWAHSLPVLLVFIISFAFVSNCFKGVTEALLPDYVSAGKRSRANGFLKIATSLTIVSSSLVSLFVVDRSLRLAFAIPALFMLVCFAVVGIALRRIPAPAPVEPEHLDHPSFWRVFTGAFRDRRRLALMLGILCFAGTWAGTRALLTPYGTEVLGLSRGVAGGLALPGSIAFLIAAAPIAYLSDRVGQARMIAYGIGVFIVGTLGAFAWQTPVASMVFIAVATVGYATFSVNAVVAMWNSAPSGHQLGVYTGLYTVAASTGGALGPAVLGWSVDLTGWHAFYLNAAVLAAVSLAVFARIARRRS
ncbi:MFS transporter [Amycolatopsis sp. NPDC098790]|uniref:MFS transporter n=1 Tax=Amycolatopsis sp. NPDC098790 TaxID=3363939 RepID=UPI00380EECC6